MALLALLTPERMSAPRSIIRVLSPHRAKRRKSAQPTTPPPIMARAKRFVVSAIDSPFRAGAPTLERQSRRQRCADLDFDGRQRFQIAQPFVVDALDRRDGHTGIPQPRH